MLSKFNFSLGSPVVQNHKLGSVLVGLLEG